MTEHVVGRGSAMLAAMAALAVVPPPEPRTRMVRAVPEVDMPEAFGPRHLRNAQRERPRSTLTTDYFKARKKANRRNKIAKHSRRRNRHAR